MGKVYLIGAGPGAPDLITVRGAKVLTRANIVFYDALIHPDTLALAKKAEKFLVGKRSGKHSTVQQFINKRLIDAAKKYQTIVRLKGGDPMLFGRAQEEILALETAGVKYEIIPGVTAALAASAELGISLTQRGVARSVTFVTPRVGKDAAPNHWVEAVLHADTAVIYMGRDEAASIAATLIKKGKSPHTPVAIMENASLPESKKIFTTLKQLHVELSFDQHYFTGPVVIMLGEVYRAAKAQEEPPSLVLNKYKSV